MDLYPVDIPSLFRNFPEDLPVPLLLVDFAEWLQQQEWGTLGYFRLVSERFNDSWIENGADLHPQFAFFLTEPSGGQIGFWRYKGASSETAPIVYVGSEGELAILADSLPEFLSRFADGDVGVPDLDDSDQEEGGRADFKNWLRARGIDSTSSFEGHHPDLTQWMGSWGKRQQAAFANHSACAQINATLRKYVKPKSSGWDYDTFEILFAGPRLKIWLHSRAPQLIFPNDIAALEAPLRTLREERRATIPERGAWLSARLRFTNAGVSSLACNYMDLPEFAGESITPEDYRSDFVDYPRSAHWLPDWAEDG